MANWNGYRASRSAGGGANNGYVAPKAKQVWAVGETVNVGFLKGLLIVAKEGNIFRLKASTGRSYTFEPHVGLSAC